MPACALCRNVLRSAGAEDVLSEPWSVLRSYLNDERVARAEMQAIFHAIEDGLKRYPMLGGLFINSDNLQCVESFWTFRNKPIHHDIRDVYETILNLAGGRWIRAKHVKAHTGGDDIRSYMNREADRLTRINRN